MSKALKSVELRRRITRLGRGILGVLSGNGRFERGMGGLLVLWRLGYASAQTTRIASIYQYHWTE